jgi:hypothetical protein
MAGSSNTIWFSKVCLVFHVIVNSHFIFCFQRRHFESVCQQKIEARSEGPKFMLSLVVTMSRRSC